ncbi:MAG TPA: cytochrome c [Bacillota bacterium]|nr:cytochrome c [Bacillota bacterium]
MSKASGALIGILTGGLVVAIGLAFSGVGVYHEPEKKEAAAASPASAEAEGIAKSTCAGCHGADLKGQVGPNLHNIGQKLDKEKIVNILKNGQNAMPKGLVPGKEEVMADYLLTLK